MKSALTLFAGPLLLLTSLAGLPAAEAPVSNVNPLMKDLPLPGEVILVAGRAAFKIGRAHV